MRIFTLEDINDFIESQLSVFPLAKANYDALAKTERKLFNAGSLHGYVQCNPARMVSSAAKTDSVSIAKRPCFLCRENRPAEQWPVDILPDWELLINPFPILPVHFTIVNKRHIPQKECPPEIVSIAEMLPGMTVFFNGAKAGASAPDHLHLQAVLTDELPLMRLVQKLHTPESFAPVVSSLELDPELPFLFFAGFISPDDKGLKSLAVSLHLGGPKGSLSGEPFVDQEKVNKFFWVDPHGLLRFVIVPRSVHRPACYFRTDEGRRIISPGCIDMTGLLVVPRSEDFNAVTDADILNIYREVGC